jgi:hypothetical protein
MLYPARFMLVGAMNQCPCAMQATRQSLAPVIQGQYKDTAEGFPDRSSIASSCTWHFSAFCRFYCRFSLPLLLPFGRPKLFMLSRCWIEMNSSVIEEFRNLSNFLLTAHFSLYLACIYNAGHPASGYELALNEVKSWQMQRTD